MTTRVRVLMVAGLLLPGAHASAQYAAPSVDCGRLQAQIASAGDPSAAGRYAAASQKQRQELNRTMAYAHSLGCDRSNFIFFGPQMPAQCPGLNAQIARMRANLDQLDSQSRGGARETLVAQYNAYCRGGAQVVQTQRRGFFDTLFGGQSAPQQPEMVETPAPAEEGTPSGGSMAVCVKSCDGSFFPVSYSARRANLDELADLCKALCPNAEVTLYTRSMSRDMKSAVSLDGQPYRDSANAFKFEKSVDPSCSCKAPGQSWVQALSDAERVLGSQRRGDVIVTPEKAEELSRPKEAKEAKPARGKPDVQKPGLPKQASQRPDLQRPDSLRPDLPQPNLQPNQPADDLTAIEGQAAAEAPTASRDSAGIAPGEVRGGKSYGIGQGEFRDVVGPDGVKRQLRVVGPTL